jgi:hypothetical protein
LSQNISDFTANHSVVWEVVVGGGGDSQDHALQGIIHNKVVCLAIIIEEPKPGHRLPNVNEARKQK